MFSLGCGLSDGYEYDIFLSYRRSDNSREWVHNHLLREMRGWFAEALPDGARIFVDEEIDKGSAWPVELERALQRSRCMVAVWNAPYFRSRWCLAEWETMRARLEHLQRAGLQDPPRLIYPLRFYDGDHFPKAATETQWRDMRPYADPRPAFSRTEGYANFMAEVKDMVHDLERILKTVPPWDPAWPVIRPDDVGTLTIPQPRLS